MSKDKRYQVFISSTYSDLVSERQAVMQTLMEMDCIPAGMELFPALDEEQFEFIKKIINDCDYYIIVLGGRYGSVSDSGISYTELEYDYAVSLGIKVVALVHRDPSSIPARNIDLQDNSRNRLEMFRKKICTGRLVKFWDSTDQIPGLVSLSLNKTIKTYPATGWVRADNLLAAQQIQDQLNKLISSDPMRVGIKQIYSSRKSLGAYFTEVSSGAKQSVLSYFVTGGFIPGVELEELVADHPSVEYTFLVIDPDSHFKSLRGEDTKERYHVGKKRDGYQHLKDVRDRHPERVSIKYYDEYPFWHYVLVDEHTLYLSFNAIGKIGFSTSPVYVLQNNGDNYSLFNVHREHLRVIERNCLQLPK